jgi:hypothetical protein
LGSGVKLSNGCCASEPVGKHRLGQLIAGPLPGSRGCLTRSDRQIDASNHGQFRHNLARLAFINIISFDNFKKNTYNWALQ